MRPTWKGTLSIGLLNVPVRMYSAVKEHDTRFRQVHTGCGEPVKYRKVCPTHQQELEPNEISKAVEVGRGTFVTVTEAELERLPLPTVGAIHIEGFLPAAAIPQARRQRPTYLGPDRGGERGYALLHRVIADHALAAIGKVAMRGNEQLVAIEAVEHQALVCWYLYWADEVAPVVDLNPQAVTLKPAEISLATQMVLAPEFTLQGGDAALDEITDDTEAALTALLEAKAQGLAVDRPALATTNVADLMDAIRASMELAKTRKGAA